MRSALDQIKTWMQANAVDTLQHLNPPAHEEDILRVEQEIGLPFPESYKQFLRLHDGESGVVHALLGDFHMLLPCQEILAQ